MAHPPPPTGGWGTSPPAVIVIQPGLWGRRIEVLTEPPVARHLLRTFRNRDDALAGAEQIARIEGWPILDRCE